jgi:hypothetical protein
MESHIKPLRLFDLSQADASHTSALLDEEEKRHFHECEGCQEIVKIFARQFSKEPSRDKGNAA